MKIAVVLPLLAGLCGLCGTPALAQGQGLLEEVRGETDDDESLAEVIELLAGADVDKVELIRRFERENAAAQLEAMAQRDFIVAMDRYNLGEYYYDRYTRSLRRDPDSPAEHYLADAQRRYSEALVEIEFINHYYPRFSRLDRVLFIWGDSLFKLDEHREAIKVFERLLREFPNFDKRFDAIYKLGECHFALRDYREAERFYERIVREYPNQTDRVYRASLNQMVWIIRHLAFDEYSSRKYRSSMRYFSRLLESPYSRFAEIPEAIFYIGECHFHLDEREKARERYDTIRTKYPDHVHLGAALSRLEELSQLYFTEAMASYMRRDYNIAAERLQFIVRHYSTSSSMPEILYRWGDSLYKLDDFHGAQRAFIRCKRDYPDGLWALYALNVLEHMSYRSEFFAEAESHFIELSMKPGFTNRAHFDRLLSEQGSRFVEVMGFDELNDSSRYVVGMSYYRMRKYREAVDVVQAINPLGEYAIYASYLAGLCQIKQNLLNDAVESFKQMARAPTTDITARLKGRAHIILAYLYQRLGRYDDAWIEYEQIDYNDLENWDDAQVGKAYLMIRNGRESDYRDVISMMRSLLRRMPYTEMAPDAYLLIGYCQLQLGRYSDAADTFDRVIGGYTIDRGLIESHPRYTKLVEDVNTELNYVNSVIIHEIQAIRDVRGSALIRDELDRAAQDAEDLKAAILELQALISGRDIIGRDITDDAEFFRAFTSFAHMQDIRDQRTDAARTFASESEDLDRRETQLALDAEHRKLHEARAMGLSEYEMLLQQRRNEIEKLQNAHVALFAPVGGIGDNHTTGFGGDDGLLDGATHTSSPEDVEGEEITTDDGVEAVDTSDEIPDEIDELDEAVEVESDAPGDPIGDVESDADADDADGAEEDNAGEPVDEEV